MTRPMEPGAEPGDSEYSFAGLVPHPDLDFQTGQPNMPKGQGTYDNWHQSLADKRTDTTDSGSTPDFFVLGNPDRFGPAPALVRESANKAPSGIDVTRPGGKPGAPFPTGVKREP